jgi:hypothetical protein
MQHCAAVRVPGAAPTPPFTLSRALEEPPDLEVSVVPVGVLASTRSCDPRPRGRLSSSPPRHVHTKNRRRGQSHSAHI